MITIKKLTLAIGLIASQGALAASFQINELGADVMGVANSGTAASEKASVQFFNPAAMWKAKNAKLSVAANFVRPRGKFTPLVATHVFSGNLLTNSNINQPNQSAVIPNLYYIQPINDYFSAGLGITSPYGLKTDYERESVARYFGELSSLQTMNINPSVSFRPFKMLSFGAGYNAQYADARLNSSFRANAGVQDAHIHNEGDDWGHGYNVGILFSPVDYFDLGLSYRSKVAYNLEGRTHVYGSAAAQNVVLAALGIQDGQKARVNISVPDVTILSARFQPFEKWTFNADIQHTKWDRIDKISIITNERALPSDVVDYHNTYRGAVGVEYAYNPNVTFRLGYANDQSPVSRSGRTVRIPDSDRNWYAAGFHLKFNKQTEMDLGYMYVDFNTVHTDQGTQLGTLQAKFSGYAHVGAIQFTYNFG